MVASHNAAVFGTKDARVRKLLTYPVSGTATYGPWVNVPGAKSLTISGDITTVVLRGDNGPQEQRSTLSAITATLNYAYLDMDVLAVVTSSTVADTGTGATANAALLVSEGIKFEPFELRAVSVDGGDIGGDVMFSLPKCVLSSFPEMGTAEEDFQTYSIGVGALPRKSDGRWLVPNVRATARVDATDAV